MLDPAGAIVAALLSHGVPGAVILVLGWWIYRKDAELAAERKARVEDAKAYNDLALKLQGQVIEAVNKLATVFDEIKKLVPRGGYR
jgi:hypothetical protein